MGDGEGVATYTCGVSYWACVCGDYGLQLRLVVECEVRNKRAREGAARSYYESYESLTHVRSIRTLGISKVFERRLEESVKD